jgi:GTP pyrophosphokinase
MHRLSTEGILADKDALGHYGDTKNEHRARVPRWLQEFVEYQGEISNPDEFIQSVQQDLGGDLIATFTPKGETIRLPEKATPIDFAFAVHPELGYEAIGCKINGRLEALNSVLKNGDSVEIVRGLGHKPTKSWLLFCKTGKAKQSIRKAIRSEEAKKALSVGHAELASVIVTNQRLEAILQNENLSTALAKRFEKVTLDEVLAAVGFGVVSIERVVEVAGEVISNFQGAIHSARRTIGRSDKPIAIESKCPTGVQLNDDYFGVVRLARCCRPLAGERIKGLLHGRRGVSVHHCRCPRVLNACEERIVRVKWDLSATIYRTVTLRVDAADRKGLLPEICYCASESGANITKADFQTNSFGKASLIIDLEVSSFSQCEAIMLKIEKAEGVLAVRRQRSSIVSI